MLLPRCLKLFLTALTTLITIACFAQTDGNGNPVFNKAVIHLINEEHLADTTPIKGHEMDAIQIKPRLFDTRIGIALYNWSRALFEINIQFSKYLLRPYSEILNLQTPLIDQQISATFYIAGMFKSLSTKKAKHDCLINAKSLGIVLCFRYKYSLTTLIATI